jgi:uncharacterized protein YkwD
VKKILLMLALLPLLAFDTGKKYLDKIELYQKDSYYKQKVYTEHDWKSFIKLKDAQAIVDPNNYDLHLLSAAVFFATNKMRESKHTKPLKFSPQLRDAATVHTAQMIEKNFFDHFNRQTPELKTPEQRMGLFGIGEIPLAENVDLTYIQAINNRTTYIELAEKIVQDFYDSPPHRKNMLGKDYTHLGCAAIFEHNHKQGVHYVKVTQDYSGDY